MWQMIVIAFFQQLAVLSSAFMQLHGLLYLFLLSRKKNIDSLVTHFAQKRNLFVKKCKDLKVQRHRQKQRKRWVNDGRTDQWWQNMFSGVSPEEDWKKNFQMTRLEFNNLCEQLGPHIFPDLKSPNCWALSVQKKVALTLYYLKDTGSMWMTANTFGVHQSTVSKVVLEVCNAITRPEYIHLLRAAEEMQRRVSQLFELKFGMTQAFACIDGTMFVSKCHPLTPMTIFVTSSTIHSMYKQYVIIMGCS